MDISYLYKSKIQTRIESTLVKLIRSNVILVFLDETDMLLVYSDIRCVILKMFHIKKKYNWI